MGGEAAEEMAHADGQRRMSEICGCIRCVDARSPETFVGPLTLGWRYACEICGNKRCPHHTDHRLACTNSNAVGQSGSAWE